MTIICAASFHGRAWIASDSLYSDEDGGSEEGQSKLLRLPFGVIGVIGTVAQIPILDGILGAFPILQSRRDCLLMAALLRTALEEMGVATAGANRLASCLDIDFIIATSQGRLFRVGDDLTPFEVKGLIAGGSGSAVALGAMWAERKHTAQTQKIVRAGVAAAKALTTGCGGRTWALRATKKLR